ncbi:ABC transporter substrate-binding protein [Microbacterium gubbeenense]|uniref:ABC transporter substrate-binding protein n=1 Tax=Microbacterium gubbeenense TaxID=159896 RepID=UPI003F948D4C
MKKRVFVSLMAVAALGLTACGAPADPDAEETAPAGAAPGHLAVSDPDFASGGELTVQVDYDVDETGGLDPQAAGAARSWMVEGLVYETLTTIDDGLEVAPALATSWEQPSDTEYVFQLDTEATFSNGRDMTAADVVGSLQRLVDTPTTWTGQLGQIDSIEATGDDEVTVTLAEPYTPFLAALANTPAAVLPMEEIEAGDIDITAEMLGTGPLVVADHRQDEYWTFEPNEHDPDVDELGFSSMRIEIVGDESTRVAALRDGSTDLAILNSVDSAGALEGESDVAVVTQQNTDFHYLIMNSISGDEALQNEDVRFAINSAIDRDAINELVLAGTSRPTGVTPAALPDACVAGDLPSAQASVEEAKAVIDELGGLELDLAVYDSEAVLSDIAQVVQQNLAEIGVTVSIESYDYATYSSLVYADPADFDLALSWFAGYADPSMVTTWWNPALAGFSSVYNNGSEATNKLIAEGTKTPAGPERAEIFADLCEAVDAESESVPLVMRPSEIGYRTDSLSPTLFVNEGYGNVLRSITEYRAAE